MFLWLTQVVTFDDSGVSGHPNHVALSRAVDFLVGPQSKEFVMPRGVKVWKLESTNMFRKYIGPLDILFCIATSMWLWIYVNCNRKDLSAGGWRHSLSGKNRFLLCLNDRPVLTYQAMMAHASQFVWYRRLFVIFSRYTYVNTLWEAGEGRHVDSNHAIKEEWNL